MTFGKAIQALKAGEIVRRGGWNPRGMWLVYIEGRTRFRETQPPSPYEIGLQLHGYVDGHVEILPHIDMFTGDSMQPGWTPTQMDMLASDWEVIDQANPGVENLNSGD